MRNLWDLVLRRRREKHRRKLALSLVDMMHEPGMAPARPYIADALRYVECGEDRFHLPPDILEQVRDNAIQVIERWERVNSWRSEMICQ